MQIPVLIEPVAGNGFKANAFGCTVEGKSREDAIDKVQKMLKDRVAAGAQIIYLDVPKPPPPWAEFAGDLRDDPMLEEWKQAMAEYRKEMQQRFEELEDS